jgi:O-antigen ligase
MNVSHRMHVYCFAFWFFYAGRSALGVLFHLGTREYVYFDSGLTLSLAIWLLVELFFSPASPAVRNSAQPVVRWFSLYLAWAFVTLLWTPAPRLLEGGKLLKIALEAAIVLILIHVGDIQETVSYSLRGFLAGAIFAAGLYPFYPHDEQGRVGVEGGLGGYEIPVVVGLAAVIAFIQWATKPGGRLSSARALLLAGGTMLLMYKGCIVAYGVSVAPYLLKSSSRTMAKGALALALLAWIIFPWVAPYLIPYVEEGGYLTLTGRVFIWADAIQFIHDRPIVGSGYDSPKVLLSSIGDFTPGHAHNEWLQNWMSLGLIGVFLFAAIFVAYFRVAWRHRASQIGKIALALLLFGLVKGMSDPSPDLCPPIGLMLLLTAKLNSVVPEDRLLAVA